MLSSGKNKKKSILKSLLPILGFLALVQIAIFFYFQSTTKDSGIKEKIEQSLTQHSGLSLKAKNQLKIQLAVNHFQAETGKLPATLAELIPVYFDSVPLNPDTSKPFAYTLENDKFYIGEHIKPSNNPASIYKSDGSQPAMSEADQLALEQEALVASLDDSINLVSFLYDPAGKRDPFRAYDASPTIPKKGSGLTSYDLGQLRLTAVVDSIVTIEDQAGKGFIARKGTKIGLNNGEIVEITKDKIKILETSTDFTGKQSSKVIEMGLRSLRDS